MPHAIINNQSVLFVHVPKTGGSSVEKYLSFYGKLDGKSTGRRRYARCSLQHLHAEPLSKIYDLNDLDYVFMVVRHPTSRVASEYKYQMRKQNWLRAQMSFSSWLTYSLARYRLDPYYRDNHFRPQHEFELPRTKVFYFERGIEHCLVQVAQDLGLPRPHEAIWEKRSELQAPVISPRNLETLYRVYAADFERFGYADSACNAVGV